MSTTQLETGSLSFSNKDVELVREALGIVLDINVGDQTVKSAKQLADRSGLEELSSHKMGRILSYSLENDIFDDYTISLWSDGSNDHRRWQVAER